MHVVARGTKRSKLRKHFIKANPPRRRVAPASAQGIREFLSGGRADFLRAPCPVFL
jgi:hypothetical protein